MPREIRRDTERQRQPDLAKNEKEEREFAGTAAAQQYASPPPKGILFFDGTASLPQCLSIK